MSTPSGKPLPDAIAVMTAWAEGDDDATFSTETLMSIVREGPDEFGNLLNLTIALVNLCGTLLIAREREQGVPPAVTLQQIARRDANP